MTHAVGESQFRFTFSDVSPSLSLLAHPLLESLSRLDVPIQYQLSILLFPQQILAACPSPVSPSRWALMPFPYSSLHPHIQLCLLVPVFFLVWFSHTASFLVSWSLLPFPSLCWSGSQTTPAAPEKQLLVPLVVAQASQQRWPQGKLGFIPVFLVRLRSYADLLLPWVCACTERSQVRAVRSWN